MTEPRRSDSTGPPGEGQVRHSRSVERHTVSAGTATEFQLLIGPQQGAPNFALRRFIMGEGGGMPRHSNEVEHEQYVLRGKALVGIGDRTFEISAGDAIFIPAGTPHSYSVLEAPFEFLCVVPNRDDAVRILDPGE